MPDNFQHDLRNGLIQAFCTCIQISREDQTAQQRLFSKADDKLLLKYLNTQHSVFPNFARVDKYMYPGH